MATDIERALSVLPLDSIVSREPTDAEVRAMGEALAQALADLGDGPCAVVESTYDHETQTVNTTVRCDAWPIVILRADE